MSIEGIKDLWNKVDRVNRFLLALVFILLVFAAWMGTVDGEKRSTRTSFCLERGYDGYKISKSKFYCWNTVNGESKKFRDPIISRGE
jgi:hypothetical protein